MQTEQEKLQRAINRDIKIINALGIALITLLAAAIILAFAMDIVTSKN